MTAKVACPPCALLYTLVMRYITTQMQKYTQLKFRELRDQLALEERDEVEKTVSSIGSRLPGSGMIFAETQRIRLKYLDKLLDELFAAEKTALANQTAPITNDLLETFKHELIQYATGRIQAIYDQINSHPLRSPDFIQQSLADSCERQKQAYTSKITTKVEIMQEELRLKIVPGGGTVINVGGDSGVINMGTVYGDIHVHIEKMKGTDARELAEIFDKFLLAIKDSSETDNEKITLMENVEMLVSQYEAPPEQRKRGWITAAVNTLSVAGSLTTLWQQFGPVIKEAFKQYLP